MVTLAQTKLAREFYWNVCIVFCWHVTTNAKEAVALVAQVEITLNLDWLGAHWFIADLVTSFEAVIALWSFITTIASTTTTAIASGAIFPIATLLICLLTLGLTLALLALSLSLALLTLTLLTWSALWTVTAIATITTVATTLAAALRLQFAHATFMLGQFDFPFGKWFTIGTDIHRRL
jgi:hypothetical protein